MKSQNRWSTKRPLLVILAASCGTPPSGSGHDGSGSSGEFGDDPPRWVTDGSSDDDGADPTRGGGGSGAEGSDESSTGADTIPAPDLGVPSGGPVTTCSCAGGEAFPNAWIANPTNGTVRKVDLESMQTVGLYYTTGNGTIGRPATTAVSIDGRAVAVANQDGDVIKIWTRPELCNPGMNGAVGLQTSQGDHALAWGIEDCVDWVRPNDYTIQIPIAWGPGTLDPVSCEYEDQSVWTAGCNQAEDVMASALRMDADTGVITDEVTLSGFPCDGGVPSMGAMDRDGGFWVAASSPTMSRLARISDAGVMTVLEVPPVAPSGLAIDSEGRVWLSARNGSGMATAARFTPAIAVWDLAVDKVVHGQSAIVEDGDGRMWLNYQTFLATSLHPGGTFVDVESMQVGPQIDEPCAGGHCEGIAADFEGRLWSTSQTDDRIYRFDPGTGATMTLGGMPVSEFSADMTGWALQNAACAGL